MKLSNNTSYDSLVISDTIENVQPVKANDIEIYDNAGNDVTTKGTITTEAAGSSATAFKWTAKQEFLTELNSSFGTQAKPLEQPRMTVKIHLDCQGYRWGASTPVHGSGHQPGDPAKHGIDHGGRHMRHYW